nr:XRE family transcriptional regulator [Alteribacter keqinensis]
MHSFQKTEGENQLKSKANEEIRRLFKSKGLQQWEAAELMEIDESVFSRLLRKELEHEQKAWIIEQITRLCD